MRTRWSSKAVAIFRLIFHEIWLLKGLCAALKQLSVLSGTAGHSRYSASRSVSKACVVVLYACVVGFFHNTVQCLQAVSSMRQDVG